MRFSVCPGCTVVVVIFTSTVGVTAVVPLGAVVEDDTCEEVDSDVAVVELVLAVVPDVTGVVEFDSDVAELSDVIFPIKKIISMLVS